MTKLRNRNKTKRRHHVTKRRSHRTRSQRGGNWLPTWLTGTPDESVPVATGSSDQPSYWSNWLTGPTDLENDGITKKIQDNINTLDAKVGDVATNITEGAIELAKEAKNKAGELAESVVSGEEKDTLIGSPYPTPSPSPISVGGKSRKYKNKKGGAKLGLVYYATPIKPVSMAGGKKHNHTCCKGKRKGKGKRHNLSCMQK